MNHLRTILAERGNTPVLWICLWCQAICQSLDIPIQKLAKPLQGKQASIILDWEIQTVGQYNSFAGIWTREWCKISSQPDWSIDILYSPKEKLLGVQFHPESVMTQNGREILSNLLLKLLRNGESTPSNW
jgi:anthranilate synthase component 2